MRCALFFVAALGGAGTLRLLEYRPLINARAHRLGGNAKVLHARSAAQRRHLLELFAFKRRLDIADGLAIIYHLLLMARSSYPSPFPSLPPTPTTTLPAPLSSRTAMYVHVHPLLLLMCLLSRRIASRKHRRSSPTCSLTCRRPFSPRCVVPAVAPPLTRHARCRSSRRRLPVCASLP